MQAYLDNSATTPLCETAKQWMLTAMDAVWGNPSSLHEKGFEAEALREKARCAVADALQCDPRRLTFTSGGTEANNLAVFGAAAAGKRKGNRVVVSAVEHPSVLQAAKQLGEQGFDVVLLPVDRFGVVPISALEDAINEKTILVSLMHTNNELGALEPIGAVPALIKRKNAPALFHVDAVQAFCKLDFSPRTLGADMISVSGHKIHAPKGVGALYIRSGLRLKPLLVGGAQEDGRRAGTEAMPQIAAFGEAARIARAGLAENAAHMAALKARTLERLRAEIPELRWIETDAPHILNLSLPGWRSEVLMNFLEAREIYVSRSSACKKGARSHVLEAIGMDTRYIDGALRIGFCRDNSEEDVDALCAALAEARRTLAHR